MTWSDAQERRRQAAELRAIAVTVMGTNEVSVIRDDGAPTAYTDNEGSIVVTEQLIPASLRAHGELVRTLFDAQALHEAAHNVRSRGRAQCGDRLQARHKGLGQFVWFIFEDVNVNHFLKSRYAYDDYSRRLKLLEEVVGLCWHAAVMADLVAVGPVSRKRTAGQLFASAVGMAVVYGVEVGDIMEALAAEKAFGIRAMRKDMTAVAEMAQQYRFVVRPAEAYDILERAVAVLKRYTDDMPMLLVPKATHGAADIDAPKDLAERLGLKGAPSGGRPLHGGRAENPSTIARGVGTGMEIGPPAPDRARYGRILELVRPEVQRLLDLLKRSMATRTVRRDWQRTGRLMYHALPSAVAASHAARVENLFSSTELVLERRRVALCLLVDLSSSMDQLEAQRILTTIAEVCGRWLRDESYAIISFGSEFARIKAFIEPYHNTRARIGGLECMGGTEALPPVVACHKMLRSFGSDTDRILVFVSDFGIEEPATMEPVWKALEADGIGVVGICLGGDAKSARAHLGKHARSIGGLRELPEAFVELYLEAVGQRRARA